MLNMKEYQEYAIMYVYTMKECKNVKECESMKDCKNMK
jgi:hypothetical protein